MSWLVYSNVFVPFQCDELHVLTLSMLIVVIFLDGLYQLNVILLGFIIIDIQFE